MMTNMENGGSEKYEGILSQAFRPSTWNTLPKLVAVITVMLGLVALIGWVLSIPLLKSILPGAVEMKANTAVGLVLSACALFILSDRPSRPQQHVAQTLGLVVLMLGLATLGQYLFGWQLGIDELLFRDATDAYNIIPGRMSFFSAIVFAFIGLALTALPRDSLQPLAWLASILVIAIGAISFLGYLWNASELVTDRWLPPIAVNTAIAFALLGIGMFRVSFNFQRHRVEGISVETRILAGFSAAFLLLIMVGGYTFRSATEYAVSTEWVEHAQAVRAELGQLYSTASDAESAQRSYLLTGKPSYKDAYKHFATDVDVDKQNLARLIGDNQEQMKNLAKLEPLIAHRIDILAKHLSIFERQGNAATRFAISRDDGIQTMQAIRNQIDQMKSLEMKLLSDRNATLKYNRELVLVGLIVSLAVVIGILIALFLGIRREILARSQAEEQLHGSAARIAAILDTVVDGIITIDEHGIIETFNPAAEHLFGYAAAEAIGQNVSMLMPEPYQSKHDGYIERFCTTGEARVIGIGREVVGQHKSGSTFSMELAVSEMRLSDQRHFTGIVHDITIRKQAEELLQQAKIKAENANHAKDSFLATMSHEIRTPLTGMLGMLEVLALTPLNHDQDKMLQAAWESARSLLRIVNDILDWSKIEEGKLALSPRPTSISQLLQEVINTYSRVASAKSLVLWQHADARLSAAHIVDPLRLSQVLNNFVSNAIKFTQSGEIELRADLLEQLESGEKIRFSVKDTGIGIAKDVQQNLFKRFSQESADTARQYGGTGLGLSICRRLAELLDGYVDLISEQGQGATFSITVTLPVSAVPGEKSLMLSPEVEQRKVKPLFDGGESAPLVLVVDDHPINRDLLARQLTLLGLRADTAEDGKVALSMWRDRRFALVITDCHMPEMDGYAFTRAVRKIEAVERLHRTPIIAWTANALIEEEHNCRAAGMDELLVKPTDMTHLKKTLSNWLANSITDNSQPTCAVPDEVGGQTNGPIDYVELSKVVADSADHIQVLQDFQSHIRSDYAKLTEMLEQGDQVNVVRTAHRMKGSSLMVGARDMAIACAAIEQAAHDGNMVKAKAARKVLDEAVRKIEAHITEAGNTKDKS